MAMLMRVLFVSDIIWDEFLLAATWDQERDLHLEYD